jgi:hemerythrin
MFIWKDSYSVNVPLIDEQHKKLFSLGATLVELLKDHETTDQFHQVMDVVDELVAYTSYHFDQEEALMKKCNYPNLDKHIKEHDAFRTYLANLEFEELVHNQRSKIREMATYVYAWIYKHVLEDDQQYASIMEGKF